MLFGGSGEAAESELLAVGLLLNTKVLLRNNVKQMLRKTRTSSLKMITCSNTVEYI